MSEIIGRMDPGLITSTMVNYGTPYPGTISTPAGIGMIKYRSPEPSGSFRPGTFRVNPVVMYRDQGSFEPGALRARVIGRGSQSNPQYLWIDEGPIMVENRPWSLVSDASAQKWAVAEAYAESNKPALDIAMMLVELDETIALLANPLKALTDLTRKTRLRVGKRVWETRWGLNPNYTISDALAGSWLTYQYGIYPLMCDVQAIIEKICNGFGGDEITLKTFRGGTSSRSSTFYTGSKTVDLFRIRWMTTCITETKYTAQVYARRIYRGGLRAKDFGFSAERIASLAWERIPLSFVIDWFVNVGSFLASVYPNADYTYLGNSVSTKSVYTASTEALGVTVSGAELLSDQAGKYTRTVSRLQRNTNLPVPALPILKLDVLNVRKTASAVALIWQRIPRSWRGR